MAQSRCPLREAEYYEKYADSHPNSPAGAEAYYNAAARYAAVIELFKSEGNQKKIPEVTAKAIDTARRAIARNGSADWSARAQALLFKVEHAVPVYGTQVE